MGDSSLFQRLAASFRASAGDVVFGMEDGTVSIFGLVFGVAATTTDTKTVLIAGASGAVAAAVSMMAGTYLDVETARDEARAAAALLETEIENTPAAVRERATGRLRDEGLSPDRASALEKLLESDPETLKSLASALEAPEVHGGGQGPLAQSLWMLVADFLAAAIPIVPFVLMPVPQGRVVSGTVTLLLLIGLGVGRARIGGRGSAGAESSARYWKPCRSGSRRRSPASPLASRSRTRSAAEAAGREGLCCNRTRVPQRSMTGWTCEWQLPSKPRLAAPIPRSSS
ncbi:MAG TPA: VIT1/CCC1 transporter family protein [Roseiarcus sp.]|nr:VIT1/CCC1 transporter family protein [Roseiarcus sp.]